MSIAFPTPQLVSNHECRLVRLETDTVQNQVTASDLHVSLQVQAAQLEKTKKQLRRLRRNSLVGFQTILDQLSSISDPGIMEKIAVSRTKLVSARGKSNRKRKPRAATGPPEVSPRGEHPPQNSMIAREEQAREKITPLAQTPDKPVENTSLFHALRQAEAKSLGTSHRRTLERAKSTPIHCKKDPKIRKRLVKSASKSTRQPCKSTTLCDARGNSFHRTEISKSVPTRSGFFPLGEKREFQRRSHLTNDYFGRKNHRK